MMSNLSYNPAEPPGGPVRLPANKVDCLESREAARLSGRDQYKSLHDIRQAVLEHFYRQSYLRDDALRPECRERRAALAHSVSARDLFQAAL